MQINNINKPILNRIENILLDGMIVNRKWLYDRGIKRSTIDYYLRSKKLETLSHGIYRKAGPPLKWQHIIYSLQQFDFSVHVGGKTALELLGLSHYLQLNNKPQIISLYGTSSMPQWINKIDNNIVFEYYKQKYFASLPKDALTSITFGHWDWELYISGVELALFEVLLHVNDEADFLIVDKYFESATTLRVSLINELLQTCKHIKTKRLFLWFSNRHNHQWLEKVEIDKIDLGSGKRVIIKNGALDTQYKITIPKEMAHNEQPFF